MVNEHIRMEEDRVFPELMRDLDEEKSARLTMMVNKVGLHLA
jgi:hypothetical protein